MVGWEPTRRMRMFGVIGLCIYKNPENGAISHCEITFPNTHSVKCSPAFATYLAGITQSFKGLKPL